MDPMVGGAEVQRSALLVGAVGAAYEGGPGSCQGAPVVFPRNAQGTAQPCGCFGTAQGTAQPCAAYDVAGVAGPWGPRAALWLAGLVPPSPCPLVPPGVTPSRPVAAGVRQRRALRFRSCREGCLLAMRSTSLRPADPTELSRLSRRSPAPSGLTAAGTGRRCASAPLGGWPFGEFCGPYPLCCCSPSLGPALLLPRPHARRPCLHALV